MSWYYAGPDARPVGPVSLEELHQRRAAGHLSPETYVIEHTGEPGTVGSWRRYREVFAAPSLPPLPPGLPTPPVTAPPANPLFPSAAHPSATPPTYTPGPMLPVASPGHPVVVRSTNSLCAWGFGLSIAGFLLSPLCGIGVLPAAPALLLCLIGFAQVQHRREQSGRGLAVIGTVLSLLALLISAGLLAWLAPKAIHDYEESTKQQQNSE